MVCDAVATTSATVSKEALAALLEMGVLQDFVKLFFEQVEITNYRGQRLRVTRSYPTSGYPKANNGANTHGYEFALNDSFSQRGNHYIRVYEGGIVEGYGDDQELTDKLAKFLQAAAGKVMQAKLVNMLKADPTVAVDSVELDRATGAVIMRVEL